MAEKKENKAAKDINLGRVQAAVWANEDGKGGVWYNTTIGRRYNDGDEWKDAKGYFRDDLPVAIVALCMAYFWIWIQQSGFFNEED